MQVKLNQKQIEQALSIFLRSHIRGLKQDEEISFEFVNTRTGGEGLTASVDLSDIFIEEPLQASDPRQNNSSSVTVKRTPKIVETEEHKTEVEETVKKEPEKPLSLKTEQMVATLTKEKKEPETTEVKEEDNPKEEVKEEQNEEVDEKPKATNSAASKLFGR